MINNNDTLKMVIVSRHAEGQVLVLGIFLKKKWKLKVVNVIRSSYKRKMKNINLNNQFLVYYKVKIMNMIKILQKKSNNQYSHHRFKIY